MSILIALITKRDGLVATDSRRFAPAWLEGGKVVRQATPESDQFNKTFRICDGKVVGGFVGLLDFSGTTVADLIRQIASAQNPPPVTIEGLADTIDREFARRLDEIDSQEVLPEHRVSDIVLVGGRNLRRRDFLIIALHFQWDACEGKCDCTRETVPYKEGHPCWYLCRGDDAATAGAEQVLKANTSASIDRQHLCDLAERSVRKGISLAGVHRLGTEKSCGGKTFVELTFY